MTVTLSHSTQFLFYGCNIFSLLGGRLLQIFTMLHASPSPGPPPKFPPWPWALGWAFQSLSCSPALTVNSGHEDRPVSWWDSWDPVGICSSCSWYLCAHLFICSISIHWPATMCLVYPWDPHLWLSLHLSQDFSELPGWWRSRSPSAGSSAGFHCRFSDSKSIVPSNRRRFSANTVAHIKFKV